MTDVRRPLAASAPRRARPALRLIAALALALLACLGGGRAQEAPADAAPLRVGVAAAPPYAMVGRDGAWSGLALQLWRRVAEDLGLAYELVEVAPREQLERLEGGDVDLLLTAPVRAEWIDRVAYGPIYHATALGVARRNSISLLAILRGLFSPRFLWIAVWLSLLLLVVGTVVWLLERHANGEQFSDEGVGAGIGAGFWWAGVTMTTIGYGDKAPVTFWGRAVALLWMLVAMGVTASLTAALVSTVGTGRAPPLQLPEDLRALRVGVADGSADARWLDAEGIDARRYDDVPSGLEAVRGRDLDAFLASTAALRFYINERGAPELRVESKPLLPRRYAFALPPGSERAPAVAAATLRVLSGDSWARAVERYLADESSSGAW